MKKGVLTRERLTNEFKEDPLFQTIEIKGLVNELLDDRTVSFLKEDIYYSASDFENMFCKVEDETYFLAKQGIMRLFMKEMASYLDTRSLSRIVVMEYKAFIKLKMALMLRKEKMRPAMIFELTRVTKYTNDGLSTKPTTIGNQMMDDSEMLKLQVRNNFIDALMYKMVESKLVTYEDDNVVINDSLFNLAANLIQNVDSEEDQLSNQGKIEALIEEKVIEEELLIELQELFYKIKETSSVEESNLIIVEMESLKDIYKGKIHLINDYVIKAQHIIDKQFRKDDLVSHSDEVLMLLQGLYYDMESKTEINEMKVVMKEMNSLREKYVSEVPLINDYVIRTNHYIMDKEFEVINDAIKQIESEILILIEKIADRTTKKHEKREYMNELDLLIASNPRVSTSIKLQVSDIRRYVNKKFLGLF